MLIILCPLGGKIKVWTAARKPTMGTNVKCERLVLRANSLESHPPPLCPENLFLEIFIHP